ncbi:GFA family protein [Chelativorans salis]|uniref:GFA family protein n=1 Tax=Chelativorans salis TaxID=2978478 RepID=A0ABT2LJP5_9HYPH|nr:GFA family protein [Chelativorans sp. EGI FJ00035]MCT7374815.1 GFA family protein [Chelativorans sp. EGI FJ00035]
MFEATCHCGAVKIQASAEPAWLNECNCSVCRRLGTLWTYYHPSEVTFLEGAGKTVAYLWGDRGLEFHHCPTCGCTTHWEPVRKEGAERMAVNARLMDPAKIAGIRVRHFDGAESFRYLD